MAAEEVGEKNIVSKLNELRENAALSRSDKFVERGANAEEFLTLKKRDRLDVDAIKTDKWRLSNN